MTEATSQRPRPLLDANSAAIDMLMVPRASSVPIMVKLVRYKLNNADHFPVGRQRKQWDAMSH